MAEHNKVVYEQSRRNRKIKKTVLNVKTRNGILFYRLENRSPTYRGGGSNPTPSAAYALLFEILPQRIRPALPLALSYFLMRSFQP